jgi:hypothetical protein
MPVNFLEQLVAEWYEYEGYFVRRNVRVGKRRTGGYECELDIVAFHPETKHLVHVEPSTDASTWTVREERYRKKFSAGKKHIPNMFRGLVAESVTAEQIAVLVLMPKNAERSLAGGKAIHVSAFLRPVIQRLSSRSFMNAAVPEQFPLLRTLQLAVQYRKDLFGTQPKRDI